KHKRNINKVLGDPLLLSSAQRASALGEIMKKRGLENFMEDFKKEVIKVRNQFAHAVLDSDENGREFFRNKSDGIVFNDDLCKKIRIDLNKHKGHLDNLIEQMKE